MRIIALFSLCFLSLASFAADPTKPHEHHGVIKPFEGAPPEITLEPKEKKKLEEGDPVFKQIEYGAEGATGGRAVAVFKVNASPKSIWAVIEDFEKYPQWISSLSECKTYKKEDDKIFVEFTVKVWPVTTTYYIEHYYPGEKKGWGTWKLDYSRLSDLDDSVGFWRVTPVEGKSDQSIVSYSVDVRVKSALLKLVKNLIVKRGLKEATQWVKTESEKYEAAHKPETKQASK